MAGMILIGDAGGSSTEWRVLDHGQILQFKTRGLNLVHTTISEYISEIYASLSPYSNCGEVHLYIAGLRESARQDIEVELSQLFTKANLTIENDLLGAARGLLDAESGWIGILGTGSNFAFYNGRLITNRVPPLGFILGDEGSGTHLGKALLRSYLRGNLSKTVQQDFINQFNLSEDEIIHQTYRSPNAKAFLATFCPFIFTHINDPKIFQLVENCFVEHLLMVKPLVGKESVSYSGSVAFYFGNVLRKVATDMGISIGRIVQSPIAGLTLFHENHKH